uniref:DDE-1 domain-containing protein n=1 Tax=Trichuris muris TaxID=70415 RepID=A0A5S6QBM9_TRIMR
MRPIKWVPNCGSPVDRLGDWSEKVGPIGHLNIARFPSHLGDCSRAFLAATVSHFPNLRFKWPCFSPCSIGRSDQKIAAELLAGRLALKPLGEEYRTVHLASQFDRDVQPLDQGAIQCIKATYTRLVFGKLRDTLHANPDCNLIGLWKRFSIADAIALIAEAVHETKPRTVSGCWKRLWRDAVSECEDIGAIDEEVMDIVNIAKELGGEGFSDMIEDDIREHIEKCGEPFTNEELEQLMQSPTGSDDDVMEDTEAQTPSVLMQQKLASIFRQAHIPACYNERSAY